MIRPPPRSPLFPYTTPSRSARRLRLSQRPGRLLIGGTTQGTGAASAARVQPLTALAHPSDPPRRHADHEPIRRHVQDRKSTRLNSSHSQISYAVFCLKKKKE